MSAHLIRTAEPRDSFEISRLLTSLGHDAKQQAIAEKWTDWTAAGNSALVAEAADGMLLGVATLHQMTVLHRPKPVGRITALIVDDAHRDRGIGKALVAAAESLFTNSGCGLLEVTSNFRWTDAHAFYEHLGYTRTSVRLAKNL